MYLTLKLVHVLAVVAFLGNITTGLLWHALALRSKDPRLLAFAMAGIIRSDRWFTVPGVVGIIASGLAMALMAGFPLLRTGWIAWTVLLFVVSGVVFAWQVAPLQRRLLRLAQGDGSGVFDYTAYRALALRWECWGAVSLLTPLAGAALMVLKPL